MFIIMPQMFSNTDNKIFVMVRFFPFELYLVDLAAAINILAFLFLLHKSIHVLQNNLICLKVYWLFKLKYLGIQS